MRFSNNRHMNHVKVIKLFSRIEIIHSVYIKSPRIDSNIQYII